MMRARHAVTAALFHLFLSIATACATSTESPADGGSGLNDSATTADTAVTNDVASDSSRSDSTVVSDAGTTISDVASDDGAAPCTPDFDVTVTCPTDLPPDDDCPDAAPSYANEVAAIIASRCTVCHRPGGAA